MSFPGTGPWTIDGQTYIYLPYKLTLPLAPTGGLLYYPMPVPITNNAIIGSSCNPDLSDLRFTDVNGNLLYHEIVNGYLSTGLSYPMANGFFFVQIPSISASTNTIIYCFYGCSSQTQHTRSWQSNVWVENGSQNFAAVYHFNKNGVFSYLDSTINENDLQQWPGNGNHTAQVVLSTASLPCGLLGAYTGYQGVLSAADSTSLEITGPNITEESWIIPTSQTVASEWIGKYTPQTYNNGYYMEYLNTEGLGCEFGFFNGASYANNPRIDTTTTIPLNIPTYIAGVLNNGTVNGEAGILCYYNSLNQPGTYPYQTGSDTITADTSLLLIGFARGGNSFNYGTIFEIRLSKITRSQSYLTYTNTVLSTVGSGITWSTNALLLNGNPNISVPNGVYYPKSKLFISSSVI